MLGLKPQQFGRSIKQFFNLADNGVDYGSWVVDAGSSKSQNGVFLANDDGNEFCYLNVNFKENTEYTIVTSVSSKQLTGIASLYLTFGSAFPDTPNIPSEIGINTFKATTISSIVNNRLQFRIGDGGVGDFVEFKLLAIIEGDATSENITEEQPYGNFDVIYTP